jgi:hypothetical protein
MTPLALLAPLAFTVDYLGIGVLRLTLISFIWQVRFVDGYLLFDFMPYLAFVLFPLVLIRLGFTHQMYRCYQGLVSKTRAITVGVIAELPILFLMMLTYLFASGTPYAGYVSIFGPIPHLFLFGIVLLILTPPAAPKQWIEEMPSPPKWRH